MNNNGKKAMDELRKEKTVAVVILKMLTKESLATKEIKDYLLSQEINIPVRKFMRRWLKKLYYTKSKEDTRGCIELVYYLKVKDETKSKSDRGKGIRGESPEYLI